MCLINGSYVGFIDPVVALVVGQPSSGFMAQGSSPSPADIAKMAFILVI